MTSNMRLLMQIALMRRRFAPQDPIQKKVSDLLVEEGPEKAYSHLKPRWEEVALR